MSAADSSPPPHTVHVVHPPPSSGIGAIAALLVAAVLIALAFLVYWQINHGKPDVPQAAAGDVAILRERLAADEARLATLEKGAQVRAAQQPDIAALASRLAKLEAAPDSQIRFDADERRLADLDVRLATLERNAPAADLQQRIAALATEQAALATRLAKLEAADPSAAMKRAAAELALANLVRASADGPFAAELKTFRALMPDADEASVLAAIAPGGAPTQIDLAARFPSVAAKALAAERAGTATTWLGRLWASLANVVVVRRIGEAKGMASEAILARAGTRLNAGDLAAAVAQAQMLKGPARAAVQDWLAGAEARLAVARTTAMLANRMAKLLAAP